MEVVQESERKFAVDASFEVPDLSSAGAVTTVGAPQVVDLSATYFDTADLRLAREGITVRRREGGDDAGWHVKLPAAGRPGDRDEVRLPLEAGEASEVPEELLGLVSAYVLTAPVVAVATLRTRREKRALRGPDGTELAELALDAVEVVDAVLGSDHTHFREVELEDFAAVDGDLDEVVRRLVAAGAVPGALVPKLVRALGAAAEAAPDVPVPPALSPSSPASDAVAAHVATQVRALRRADVGVRRGAPDAVHQMRVAARRLRSGLKVFRPLLDAAWADELRSELGWLAGELGRARDSEVLVARLEAGLGALPDEIDPAPARVLLAQRLGARTHDAQDAAVAALRSPRYALLLEQLVGAAHLPPTTPAAARPSAKALPPLVGRAWRTLARDVALLRLDGADEDWHEARKQAKAVRYAAEAVAPPLGKPARALARRAEAVTELLGEHQDASIAAAALAEVTRHPRGTARAGFALGVLYAAQRASAHRARTEFLALWRSAGGAKAPKWLRDRS